MCISYEGTWPWLMLQGEPPEENLLRIWKEEFASLIKKHRNHPSVIFWTVNNEMKFEAFDRKNPDRLRKKWTISYHLHGISRDGADQLRKSAKRCEDMHRADEPPDGNRLASRYRCVPRSRLSFLLNT